MPYFFLSYSSSKILSSFPSYVEHFSPNLFSGQSGIGIPVTNFLSCFTSENVLIFAPSHWRIFSGHKILGWQFFQYLKNVSLPLVSIGSIRNMLSFKLFHRWSIISCCPQDSSLTLSLTLSYMSLLYKNNYDYIWATR